MNHTGSGVQSGSGKRMMGSGAEAEVMQIFTAASFALTHQTKKVFEFYSSCSLRYVYMRREERASGFIRLVVPPESRLQGADEISGVLLHSGYRFSSNMRKFPKQVHQGKNEIHYGLPVDCSGTSVLGAFLKWFEDRSKEV
jgi:hypothetical protein